MSFFSSLGNFFGFGNDDADYNDLVSEENQPTIIRPVITVKLPITTVTKKNPNLLNQKKFRSRRFLKKSLTSLIAHSPISLPKALIKRNNSVKFMKHLTAL